MMPNTFKAPDKLTLLQILSLTVGSATLLTDGGIFHNPIIKQESNFRKARRALEKLYKSGLATRKEYLVMRGKKSGIQKLYRITKRALQILKKEDWKCHEINKGTAEHDYLTALYLIYFFRYSKMKKLELRWYPPFNVGNKRSDGGIAVYKNGKIACFMMIESDRATHDHREMREKFLVYRQFLAENEKRQIVFLVSGIQRSENLQELLKNILKEQKQEFYLPRINFVCPLKLPPDVDIFSLKENVRCPVFLRAPDK